MGDPDSSGGLGAPFLDQLVDWQKFEVFVRDLHAIDPDVVAERDITEIGRSGAQRQIDVKLTQVKDGQPDITLIECKRWRKKVDRQRIDVLAASVEDLDAARGVMFTTSGYEAGAEAYAKHKGIEIFVVRDLVEEEWGLPGRVVWFNLHYYGGELVNFREQRLGLVAVVSNPPKSVGLELAIAQDQPHDPTMVLYSVIDGSPGPNLTSLLIQARSQALELLSRSIEAWDTEDAGELKAFRIPIELDLSAQPHRHLMRGYGAIHVERLAMDLLATVTQARFETDRGASFDLALAVENYVTRARQVVARQGANENLRIFNFDDADSPINPDDPEILRNGALFKVFFEPWVRSPHIGRAEPTSAVTFRLPDWEVSVTAPSRPKGRTPGPQSP